MSINKISNDKFIDKAPLACIIMASGRGERFGDNKLLVNFKGKPLLQHILEATSLPFAERLVVSRYQEVAALCQKLGVKAILHNLPYQNDTVRIGLENLSQQTYSGIMFCAGDQPLLKQATLVNLWKAFVQDPSCIYRTAYNSTPGNPIIFPASLIDELLLLPQDRGGSYLTKKYPEQVRYIPVQDSYELYDIDTQEDLDHLLLR